MSKLSSTTLLANESEAGSVTYSRLPPEEQAKFREARAKENGHLVSCGAVRIVKREEAARFERDIRNAC